MLKKLTAVALVAVLSALAPIHASLQGGHEAERRFYVTMSDTNYRLVVDAASRTAMVEESPVRCPFGNQEWIHVMELATAVDETHISLRVSTGSDVFELVVGHSNGLLDPESDVEVIVNGNGTSIAFEQIGVAASAANDVAFSPEAVRMAEFVLANMNDSQGFFRSARSFGGAMAGIFEQEVEATSPQGFWACAACAAALAAYGISLYLLIGACAGTAGLGCILTFTALSLDKIGVLSSCLQCVN